MHQTCVPAEDFRKALVLNPAHALLVCALLTARQFLDFRDLRQDPRFVAILREMDAPWPR